MQWSTKKVLITVKAYPEYSKKHHEVVCVAGITENRQLIRLFPVPFQIFRGKIPVQKYTWISVDCREAEKEKIYRKESHRIRDNSIKIIDDSLISKHGHATPWGERKQIILPLVSPSLEDLMKSQDIDGTSLGIIKVHELIDFYATKPLDEMERNRGALVQKTLFGNNQSLLERMDHIFRYKFKCCEACSGHDISIEDWEVFQLFRSMSDKYDDPKLVWEKIKDKYYTQMIKKDLYFYMGTHSQWPSWMIIGAFYPPKEIQRKLNGFGDNE
jgi:hypothetical protein